MKAAIAAFISLFAEPNLIYLLMVVWVGISIYLINKKRQHKSVNDYLYDSIPSMFVTLGVLGTFGGIFLGLQNFQVDTMENIEKSIPTLLEGLRGAFSTSIIGIILSLIFGRIADIIQGTQKEAVHIPSGEEEAILGVNESLSSVITQLKTLNTSFEENIPSQLEELKANSKKQLSFVKQNATKEHQLLTGIKESILDNTEKEKTLLTNISDSILAESKTQIDALRLIEKQGEVINTSVIDLKKDISKQLEDELSAIGTIKEQILANQSFLDTKFKEFGELLAKNNTEALVEVMKEATAQFNTQMKELIDKLVKENFQELNNSVQQLNSWQIENKKQVATLIDTFNKVTENFVSTSSSIQNITTNTEILTDKNGYLSVLIQELQKVMIDDTKFQEITTKLIEAVENVKENINSFDKSTGEFTTTVGLVNENVVSLNSWQDKNKEQVTTLMDAFDKARANFESTSKSIKTITENTEKLTDKNSHLTNLIKELQKVMINDTKFQEITSKLESTVVTVEKNINAFDKTTNKLNNWVVKQMNFSDSVAKLLSKLEKIDKIKDVNEIFWKETKTQLNEGVNIISKANKKLSKDIDAINTEFYERLNDTLQNLDNLIIRIIEEHTV